jgi:hypothetical protein
MEPLPHKTGLLLKISILLIGLGACFWAYFLASPEISERIVNKAGYYFAAAAFFAFLYAVFHVVRIRLPEKRHARYLAGAVLAASCLLFIHEDLGPKVAMEEYELASTSKSLAMERDVEVLTLGRNFNEYFIRADQYVDERPWLYPFVVSLVHDFSGYRLMNNYLVNAFLAIFLLSLTAGMAYRIGGLPAGVLGPFLWAALPLLSQHASGGGLEVLNLVLLLVVILCSFYYIEAPGGGRLNLLALAMVCLSFSSYQSLVYWLFVAGVIVLGWWRSKKLILPVGLSATPLLLAILAAHASFLAANPNMAGFGKNIENAYGLEYLLPNLSNAIYFLFAMGDELPNAFLLGIFGVLFTLLSLRLALHSIMTKDKRHYQSLVFLLLAVVVVGQFVMIMARWDGQLTETAAAGDVLPLFLLMIASILVFLSARIKRGRMWWIVYLVVGVFILCMTLPNKAKGVYGKEDWRVREANWLEVQAKENFEPMSLIVDQETVIWTLNEWHCIKVSEAFSSLPRMRAERERGKYPQIYLIDRANAAFDLEEQIKFKSDADLTALNKTLIAEKSFQPLEMTRIYKVEIK